MVDRPRLRDLLPTTTESVEATLDLGSVLAERLLPAAVVGLYGDLGTGKTHLVKGIARGLGIDPSTVRSPTFTILHTYDEGRCPLHHFDAYRVRTPDEFVELGFEEYVPDDSTDPTRPDALSGITCIEWAERVASLLPPSTVHLTLTHDGPNRRRIALRSDEA